MLVRNGREVVRNRMGKWEWLDGIAVISVSTYQIVALGHLGFYVVLIPT